MFFYLYKLFKETIKVLNAKQSVYNNISYEKKLEGSIVLSFYSTEFRVFPHSSAMS